MTMDKILILSDTFIDKQIYNAIIFTPRESLHIQFDAIILIEQKEANQA
jgi:hypothetical protein